MLINKFTSHTKLVCFTNLFMFNLFSFILNCATHYCIEYLYFISKNYFYKFNI